MSSSAGARSIGPSTSGTIASGVSADGYIRVRVITSEGGNEVHFRLKPDVAFVRMKQAYCKKLGHVKDELRFVYDGIRITDDDTPNKLEMIDGDVIEIYQERTGGGM